MSIKICCRTFKPTFWTKKCWIKLTKKFDTIFVQRILFFNRLFVWFFGFLCFGWGKLISGRKIDSDISCYSIKVPSLSTGFINNLLTFVPFFSNTPFEVFLKFLKHTGYYKIRIRILFVKYCFPHQQDIYKKKTKTSFYPEWKWVTSDLSHA